jgi:hypothetical protein
MAYEHLSKVSYKSLTKIMQTQPPYKGSEQWPLGNRKYSRLFFVKVEDTFFLYEMNNKAYRENTKDAARWRVTRLLAKVRPDNSYEFINAAHQGEKIIHSALTGMVVQNRTTHGGGVVGDNPTRGNGRSWGKLTCDAKHPLFKGLRIDLDTGETTTPYVLHYRKPIKKLHNAEMDKYADFLKMYPVMLDSTTLEGLTEVVKDTLRMGTEGEQDTNKFQPFMRDAVAAIEREHYLDAAILFHKSQGGWTGIWANRKEVYGGYANDIKRVIGKKFRDTALRYNNDIFKMTLRKEDEPLAACKWGYHIELKQGDLLSGYTVERI